LFASVLTEFSFFCNTSNSNACISSAVVYSPSPSILLNLSLHSSFLALSPLVPVKSFPLCVNVSVPGYAFHQDSNSSTEGFFLSIFKSEGRERKAIIAFPSKVSLQLSVINPFLKMV